MDTAGGVGEAPRPGVIADSFTSEELREILRLREERYEAEAPARRVDGLRAKVAKLEAHLAAAKQSLADELAAQKGKG